MQADTFDLHSFHTMTGTTFMLLTEPHTPEVPELLRTTVYELYCDYVLKNPFHETDQVIKSELFDSNLVERCQAANRRWGVTA
ncbi:trafficking particle complex subunit 4-like [Micractinium conductrix]|uniref:Trafficking protein particle complex subunit n=1 Tax=Micractinium conductrix TaxID=554055 RepID=A0A2P6V9Y5_9CHLO|nr:trafficking particle complex subunit 4-like [Micractinium conductrix]|eukprot:PSC70888.1 trafficking particle complex subunit 4-like [Micractinium conductrix]